MKKTIACNRLVWVREVPHAAGTKFSVVDEPKSVLEIDQTTADAWRREGWILVEGGKAAAASEGA